jgi:large subunit ribosomal protein L29
VKSRELADVRKKDEEDLRKLLSDKRRALMDARFSLGTGALENSARLGQLKRDVAQILTVLKERGHAAAAAK